MDKILKSLICIIAAGFFCSIAAAQELSQTVKGKIADQVSGMPLPGASVIFQGSIQEAAEADENGSFSISLPVGRYRMTVSHTGYRTLIQELLVISGKQTVVSLALEQAVQQLKEIEVTDTALPAEVPGEHSLSIEKTLRVPANFFDPVRVATAFPGVIAANDQANNIIVRANSPNGLLWRLNGLDIVNPNHLANAGTMSDKPAANGGGVNILSAQMLARTDFYTGYFPANYGNALAGIIDMNLRYGNKDHFEYTAQASLIGLDFSAEGPLDKKHAASFLANYRYSTVGLLSKAGINFGDEAITFQDLSFNLNSDFKNGGNISWFGFYGASRNDFDKKEPAAWKEDKDRYDINYDAGTYAMGLNYTVPLSGGKLFAGVAYSHGEQERNAEASDEFPPEEIHTLSDANELGDALLSGSIKYAHRIGKKSSWEAGIMTDYTSSRLKDRTAYGCDVCSVSGNTGESTIDGILFQPFANFALAVSPSATLDAGLRYVSYSFNKASSLEPRIHFHFRATGSSALDLSYALVSQWQLPRVYMTPGNNHLGLTKSHHADAGYTKTLSGFNLRTGIFYQHLFDVPVETVSSAFSAINLMEDTSVPMFLVNEGTGTNYGAGLTIERSFFANHYFLLGGSYYESQYRGSDNIRRDSRFNGKYTLSGVYGKEWINETRHRTIGLNARLLCLGGLRRSPVDLTASRISYETVYESSFSEKSGDYFRMDLRLSFRKDKAHYTRTFAVDIQNLTGQENEAYRYYDHVQNKIVTKLQLGMIPVLLYRIDF